MIHIFLLILKILGMILLGILALLLLVILLVLFNPFLTGQREHLMDLSIPHRQKQFFTGSFI